MLFMLLIFCCCSAHRASKFGEVGLANGLRLLDEVLGGGGGGSFLWPYRESNSEFLSGLSGTGGLPVG